MPRPTSTAITQGGADRAGSCAWRAASRKTRACRQPRITMPCACCARQGIDPFQRSSVLELVKPDSGQRRGPPWRPHSTAPDRARRWQPCPRPKLGRPKPHALAKSCRSSATSPGAAGASWRCCSRGLSFFVFLPTLLVGCYFYIIATPMYATKSEFVIQQAESRAAAAAWAALFRARRWPPSRTVSRCKAIWPRATRCCGWTRITASRRISPDPAIDAIQRLDADATNEAAYAL